MKVTYYKQNKLDVRRTALSYAGHYARIYGNKFNYFIANNRWPSPDDL